MGHILLFFFFSLPLSPPHPLSLTPFSSSLPLFPFQKRRKSLQWYWTVGLYLQTGTGTSDLLLGMGISSSSSCHTIVLWGGIDGLWGLSHVLPRIITGGDGAKKHVVRRSNTPFAHARATGFRRSSPCGGGT